MTMGLEVIRWRDSGMHLASEEWTSMTRVFQAVITGMEVTTVGMLVHEDDDVVILGLSIDETGGTVLGPKPSGRPASSNAVVSTRSAPPEHPTPGGKETPLRLLRHRGRTKAARAGGRRVLRRGAWIGAAVAFVVAGCAGGTASPSPDAKSVVVTYTRARCGGPGPRRRRGGRRRADAQRRRPPRVGAVGAGHRDLTHADLLVENGLGLEGGMGDAFDQAERGRRPALRRLRPHHGPARRRGRGRRPERPGPGAGCEGPHLWMDPLTMRDVVDALATQLRADLGIDVSARATDLDARWPGLDDEVAGHRRRSCPRSSASS